jgi:phosphatidylserine decarboxylase
MNIAKGSKIFILSPIIAFIFFSLLFIFLRDEIIGAVFLFLSLVFFIISIVLIIFFRDPERDIGKGIVACADGRIREIINVEDDYVGVSVRISTFMNLHNVHVNRMPIDGKITDIVHKSGFHLPAFKKESEKNERVIIKLESEIGKIKIIQIAGTLARRIVPYINKKNKLKKGERIGIIRLGSRVDLYLPNRGIKKIYVKKGDIVKAGENTIAEIDD